MDGKGCWRDNVFVERLWKSIKYEEVYLHAYDSVSAAKQGLGRYLTFYNQRRPRSRLDRKTPDEFYEEYLPHAAPRRLGNNRQDLTYEAGKSVQTSGTTSVV
jgi:transposase InsO family protein